MQQAVNVKILDWDSQFFGVKTGCVSSQSFVQNDQDHLQNWIDRNGIIWVHALVNSDDNIGVSLFENCGFHFTDMRMTYERGAEVEKLTDYGKADVIRQAEDSDVTALCEIARKAHKAGRYFYDSKLPSIKAQDFYAEWIRASVAGFADCVFVVDAADGPLGYITCCIKDGVGHIGLLGLHETARGGGYGAMLMNRAMNWFSSHSVGCVNVVTQGRNVIAQRFYQKNGFYLKQTALWYHKWTDEN